MAMVPNGVETLPKILIAWVGCTNVTDDRQTTDGRTTTYSKHEHEFTFAKNEEEQVVKAVTKSNSILNANVSSPQDARLCELEKIIKFVINSLLQYQAKNTYKLRPI